MEQELSSENTNVREKVIEVKNHNSRNFKVFTDNFYLLKSALRYFAVKQGLSFTSSKVADRFPLAIPVAGSGLKVLEELEVIQPRKPGSGSRYMPQDVDMDKLKQVESILEENYEINDFWEP